MKTLKSSLILEASLMKDSFKTILIFLVMAVSLGVFYASPAFTISYIMAAIAIMGSSPFIVEEKVNMERFYSTIPLSNLMRVVSRYLFFLLLGTIVFIVTMLVQNLVFSLNNTSISTEELFLSGTVGIFILIFFLSIQLPSYYKWGPTKGRLLSLIPTAFVIAVPLTLSASEKGGEKIETFINILLNNSAMVIVVMLLLALVLLIVSIFLSLLAIRTKEI